MQAHDGVGSLLAEKSDDLVGAEGAVTKKDLSGIDVL
jgi:hypothetical protein